MEKAKGNQEAVMVKNCVIKESTYGLSSVAPMYEIVASSRSKIELSPKKFKFDKIDVQSGEPKIYALDEVEGLSAEQNQRITVVGKIVSVGESAPIKTAQHKELVKQECLIADANSVLRLVLWEENVGTLKVGCSYMLKHLNVKVFDHVKYLSYSDKVVVEEVEDIGVTVQVDEGEQLSTHERQIEGEVVAGVSSEEYISCMMCSGKVTISTTSALIGKCSKFAAVLKLNKCQKLKTAKIVVEGADEKRVTLTAFNQIIDSIISNVPEDAGTVDDRMMLAPARKYTYNRKRVISSTAAIGLYQE